MNPQHEDESQTQQRISDSTTNLAQPTRRRNSDLVMNLSLGDKAGILQRIRHDNKSPIRCENSDLMTNLRRGDEFRTRQRPSNMAKNLRLGDKYLS